MHQLHQPGGEIGAEKAAQAVHSGGDRRHVICSGGWDNRKPMAIVIGHQHFVSEPADGTDHQRRGLAGEPDQQQQSDPRDGIADSTGPTAQFFRDNAVDDADEDTYYGLDSGGQAGKTGIPQIVLKDVGREIIEDGSAQEDVGNEKDGAHVPVSPSDSLFGFLFLLCGSDLRIRFYAGEEKNNQDQHGNGQPVEFVDLHPDAVGCQHAGGIAEDHSHQGLSGIVKSRNFVSVLGIFVQIRDVGDAHGIYDALADAYESSCEADIQGIICCCAEDGANAEDDSGRDEDRLLLNLLVRRGVIREAATSTSMGPETM